MSNVANKNSKSDSKKRKKFKKGNKPLNSSADNSTEVKPSGHNDASWYASDPNLLRDAGSYSFGNPIGNSTRVTELSQFDSSITYSNLGNLDTPIPGVAAIEFVPTYGGSQEGLPGNFNSANPINTIARALYSKVREANSGSWTYHPSDLMKYMIAMDSVFMFEAWMSRLYGLARVYSSVNRYWPKGVIFGCHVDFDDLMLHLADLRYYINSYVVRANQLAVPEGMPIFYRHLLLNGGVYKDKESDKAQLYLFNPRFVYKLNETETPKRLDPVLINNAVGSGSGGLLNVADIMALGDSLLSAVLTSEDIGIICGDIMKKFTNYVKLTEIPVDYAVFPDYVEEVASQIQNCRLVGDILVSAPDKLGYIYEGTTIGVDSGMLYQQLVSLVPTPVINLGHPLSLDKDMASIEPKDVVEATRLLTSGIVKWSSDALNFQSLICECGSEVCTKMAVIGLDKNTGVPSVLSTFASNGYAYTQGPYMLSSFDKHPILYHMTTDKTTGTINFDYTHACYDYDNYTIIGRTGLRKLHETALFGEFGVGMSDINAR